MAAETRKSALLVLLLALIFFFANRTAYKGYFEPDDLDNIGWNRQGKLLAYVEGVLTPRFFPQNFRPVGHFFYRLVGGPAGLRYTPYLATLQTLHIVCIILLWLLLRELKFSPWAAFLGGLFFACHMGAFDAYWHPMYVFDVLCGLFSLLCLLFYVRGRWLLALASMWLAYKSKELAVMLPVVLAWWEWRLGERRWKQLIPFFCISALFGIQALFVAPNPASDYTFQFTLPALAATLRFYFSRLGLLPFAGLALLALPFLARDRRATWGVVTFVALLAPLLFLPGRLYGAYLYVPLIGAAVALAALAARSRTALIAVGCFYLLWIPLNYRELRARRSAALAGASDNRRYVMELTRLQSRNPGLKLFLYDGLPESMRPWGVVGALRTLFDHGIDLYSVEETNLAATIGGQPVAMLSWNPLSHALLAVSRTEEASYVDVSLNAPVWQLTSGWYPREAGYRWTRPTATAQLARPAGARKFDLTVNMPDLQLATVGHPRLELILDGKPLEPKEFTTSGWQTVSWPLAPTVAGRSQIEFRITPDYRPPGGDSRVLGLPIGAFGFK